MLSMSLQDSPFAVIWFRSESFVFFLKAYSSWTSDSWLPFWTPCKYFEKPSVFRISSRVAGSALKSSSIWVLKKERSLLADPWMADKPEVASQRPFFASMPKWVSMVWSIPSSRCALKQILKCLTWNFRRWFWMSLTYRRPCSCNYDFLPFEFEIKVNKCWLNFTYTSSYTHFNKSTCNIDYLWTKL